MKFNTIRFGEIEVQDTEVFSFPEGLPGFEQLIRFVIIKPNLELPFSFLQSVEDGGTAFIVVSPFVFYPKYEFELSEETKQELAIKEEQDVLVWNIVSIRDSLEDATINLLAPVILNTRDRLGKQIVLHGTEYMVKQKLIPAQQAVAERGDA
ncbi:MAG: flagellar assembly factor FliW [Paenibacillus sp.]|jgi:flagellar assembly factor FliW|nr:flagellar assembly factor FliW [Paenibacillus sp.]